MLNIFNPSTDFYENYIDKGRYRLAWRLTLFFTIVFFALSSITVFTNLTTFIFYAIVFLLSITTLIVIHKTKKYQFTYWIFTITASILVILSINLITTTLHYSDFLWVLCIILFAFIGLDKKVALFFLVVHVISMGYYIFFKLNGYFEELTPRTNFQLITVFIEIVFTLVVMVYLINEHINFQKFAEKELTKANQKLKDQFQVINSKNEENQVLIKEVHHRVKNNLQIVISLLRIQSEELNSPETKKHFSEAINRIMSISLVHQKLYQEKEIANINIKDYLQELFQDISNYVEMSEKIHLKINSNTEKIGLKTVIPLGLLTNELFTNSFKHAFDSGKGEVEINIHCDNEDNVYMTYKDSGTWKSDKKAGFGLELINVLTQQLDGDMERKGSQYDFKFKDLDD